MMVRQECACYIPQGKRKSWVSHWMKKERTIGQGLGLAKFNFLCWLRKLQCCWFLTSFLVQLTTTKLLDLWEVPCAYTSKAWETQWHSLKWQGLLPQHSPPFTQSIPGGSATPQHVGWGRSIEFQALQELIFLCPISLDRPSPQNSPAYRAQILYFYF